MTPQHQSPVRLARITHLFQHHPVAAYAAVFATLMFIGSLGTAIIFYKKPIPAAAPPAPIREAPKPEPAPVVYYSPLTGLKVDSEAATKQPVTAVMIENSPQARPQSGLYDAGIVYEAIAEGGITRFLTLFQEAKPSLIGPVRSLRMYYVDWLAPYQASVAHVGGSYNALQEIRSGKYRDIDQFFNAGTYWRSADRYAPHNVYTSFEKLDALNTAKGYTTSTFTGFARADGTPAPAESRTASSVTINFSGPLYNTSYAYSEACNCYIRSLAGVQHLDREKGPISPAVVIAMNVTMNRVMEDGYRESIQTTGNGPAVIFQNGTATNATWSKESREAPLRFLDGQGAEIPLTRGQTWIAAVPTGVGSVAWQ